MLSAKQIKFLEDLNTDPRWKDILSSLEQKPPTYTPSEDAEEQKTVNKFIHDSGVFKENKRILTILGVTK